MHSFPSTGGQTVSGLTLGYGMKIRRTSVVVPYREHKRLQGLQLGVNLLIARAT